ncbi:hypothetical protein ASC77_02355 [Nocardioides sp. Root1257]|uniref:hypothetical protein n=1 Tax=unclassified Nocardioides TaxID=2615069 RepID=UPI0006FB3DDD|nr:MULTISPECIES: hypothetical protein [unclassified Nocardioides]KQW53159.1 hypothetical protein ASC77_02355 [Nocardioides sp. Root1257]KRC55846.1 hypothetical protein ASE24_02355 [Nocardioides sp. Root224]
MTTPYPRPGPEGVPEPTGWRLWAPRLLVPLLVLGTVALIPVVVLGFLYALNPMGDEWQCSDGEAPAGNACYPLDEPLPAGVHWDPLGNRPMPYNCDKDGWTQIQRDGSDDQDCLNDDLPLPAGWHEVS